MDAKDTAKLGEAKGGWGIMALGSSLTAG